MRAFSGAASSRLMLSIKEYFLHVTIVNGDRSWYLLLAGRCHAVSIAIPIAAEVKFNPGTLQVLLLRAEPRHGAAELRPSGRAVPGLGAAPLCRHGRPAPIGRRRAPALCARPRGERSAAMSAGGDAPFPRPLRPPDGAASAAGGRCAARASLRRERLRRAAERNAP